MQIVNGQRIAWIEGVVSFVAVPEFSDFSIRREYPVGGSDFLTQKELVSANELTWEEELTTGWDVGHRANTNQSGAYAVAVFSSWVRADGIPILRRLRDNRHFDRHAVSVPHKH